MEFILKSSLIIGILYSFYKLFLQKETFFKSIRGYFIIGLLTTVILPLLIIPIYIEATQMVSYVPEINESANMETKIFTETAIANSEQPFNWIGLLTSLYFIGLAFFSIKFIIEIISLYRLIHQSNKFKNDKITFAETIKSIAPFSIFNYIVYNKNQFTKTELAQIITHEKVHIKQLHTYDMFLVHILVIVQWFNPFAWLYKKELEQNLEFLADKHAQENIDTLKEYQYLLLKTSIKKNPFALSTNFYNSLIKKRIIMLQKSPSKKLNQLKYVLLIPLLALFLYAFNTKEIIKPVNETLFPNLVSSVNKITEVKSANSVHKENKVIEIAINKNTTEKQLDKIKKDLKAEGITVYFNKVKRNKSGQIISIKIDAKNKNSNVSFSSNNTDGIKQILLKLKGDSISITDTNTHNMHFTREDDVSHFVSDKKHKKHKKHKTKSFYFQSDDNNANVNYDVDIDYDADDTIFIVNGKKITKEAFEKMDKNDIKTIEIESDTDNIHHNGKSKHIKVITENVEEDKNGSKTTKEIRIIKSDANDNDSLFHEFDDDDENTITTYKVNGKKITKEAFEKMDKSKIKDLEIHKEKKVEKKE